MLEKNVGELIFSFNAKHTPVLQSRLLWRLGHGAVSHLVDEMHIEY